MLSVNIYMTALRDTWHIYVFTCLSKCLRCTITYLYLFASGSHIIIIPGIHFVHESLHISKMFIHSLESKCWGREEVVEKRFPRNGQPSWSAPEAAVWMLYHRPWLGQSCRLTADFWYHSSQHLRKNVRSSQKSDLN